MARDDVLRRGEVTLERVLAPSIVSLASRIPLPPRPGALCFDGLPAASPHWSQTRAQ